MITLNNVTKQFESSNIITTAVNKVNLAISRNEFIAIVGPSGSGKSTLINLICGLTSPTSGNILYNQYNLNELNVESKAKTRLAYIGQIFQDFRLIEHLNVRENILLPLKLASTKINGNVEQKLKDITEKLKINHRLSHKPNTLSGGEQQRVSIARALINDPSYIIADEPTGNLDNENTQEVIKILSELNSQGKGIIVVTHDDMVARAASRQIRFSDGRILSS